MKALPLLLISIFCIGATFAIEFHPAQQFTTDFKVWVQYNASWSYNQVRAAEPFIKSEPLSPFSGKVYFDWNQQGFRLELQEGQGAPYDFKTTIIVHPTNVVTGKNSFNVTWNMYWYLSNGKCWTYKEQRTNQPFTIDGFSKNATFVNIQTVDGFTCAIFSDSANNQYAIRIPDLAIIRAQGPYNGFLNVPILEILGGFANASTWIDMYNPQLGPINPSQFAVPAGKCIAVQNFDKSWLSQIFTSAKTFNPTNYLLDMAKTTLKRTEASMMRGQSSIFQLDTPVRVDQQVPTLAQAFTADILLTVNSSGVPPYKDYTVSGKVAFDFTKFGAYVMWNSVDGDIPFVLKTGFIVSPSSTGVEWLFSSPEGRAWSVFYFQWIFSYLFPNFQLPPDSIYAGEAVVNGDKCGIWNYWWGYRSLTVFVRQSDGALVRGFHYDDPTWRSREAYWTLSNIKLSVDPSLYARPKNTQDTMIWNPSWASHFPWYWCLPFC